MPLLSPPNTKFPLIASSTTSKVKSGSDLERYFVAFSVIVGGVVTSTSISFCSSDLIPLVASATSSVLLRNKCQKTATPQPSPTAPNAQLPVTHAHNTFQRRNDPCRS